MRKTIMVVAATGSVGRACVDELIRQDIFNVEVLVRDAQEEEKSSSGVMNDAQTKQALIDDWSRQGVVVKRADIKDSLGLIPALQGVDYLVSCVPFFAAESQYPLIWAAKEAGVERFVPSEFGFIYEWEQFWPTDTVHRSVARQKAFIRRVIELAGLDFTIIPAGLFIEYYMLEPVNVMGDGHEPFSWSCGPDVGRIIPHVLAHPLSRNAVCPVAATAYCSWNELLDIRDRALGRKVERRYLDAQQWKTLYRSSASGLVKVLGGIGIAATECPPGMPLWAHWNARYLPSFTGTPLERLFPDYVEPFVQAQYKLLGEKIPS